MSRLTTLIAQARAKDPDLAAALEAEFRALSSRRQFGLNFERHQPEAVEIPGRPIRKGDKVRVLPPRGSTQKGDQRLWRATKVANVEGGRVAHLVLHDVDDPETQIAAVKDLVVVAEFRDPIYPGLRSTGRVERGGDKPFHTVINAENFHALQTLTYTHRGRVDAIYIDPPYNTGARDWKYNNDYVDGEDAYRHSKWLAFMERRLKLARQLLNPDDSVLIVTIDEKEVHRLALLLEQVFPEARIQLVSSLINPAAVARKGLFGRSDEYICYVMLGEAGAKPLSLSSDWVTAKGRTHRGEIRWDLVRKSGSTPLRKDRPDLFYPFFIMADGTRFHSVGEPIALDQSRAVVTAPSGTVAVWPMRRDGTEGRWRLQPSTARTLIEGGFLRLGEAKGENTPIYYLAEGERAKILEGLYDVTGKRPDGSVITSELDGAERRMVPGTQWRIGSHDATQYGTRLLASFLPDRKFPFPKSLYAVEDALRFFIHDKPAAVVLDFFAGSGTTAHAVMRLNKQDQGRRQCISVTNNEVSAEEQGGLRADGLRPGDLDWEALGICEYITKPRLEAAITGKTPNGEEVKGDYRFSDEFPMADGLEENVEFFTLTYETPWRVARNRDFTKIAPLLWLRAGSEGRRIDTLPAEGWAVADTYGVIADLDRDKEFQAAVAATDTVKVAYIVTDDDRRFQMVAGGLPERVEPVRLYESYLNNFEINTGRD